MRILQPASRPHDGFTLAELSIVLVVIGLVIGAIFVGKDLIRAAENRAFISQLEQYDSAVNTFRTKYDCLPGDCLNGHAFGFVMNGDGNGFITTLSTDGGVTNVDVGNPTPASGVYFVSYATPDGNAFPVMAEGAAFWEELQSAQLIKGLSKIGSDGGGYPLNFPVMKNDTGHWFALGAWSGRHYYRTGMSLVASGLYFFPCNYAFAPIDVLYVATKYGQTAFTTTGSIGNPDALAKDERIIVTGSDTNCPSINNFFYNTPSTGPGGPSSDVCINTATTPPSLNVTNDKKLCDLMIQAKF